MSEEIKYEVTIKYHPEVNGGGIEKFYTYYDGSAIELHNEVKESLKHEYDVAFPEQVIASLHVKEVDDE